MRTRSSSNLPGESSPNPTSLNPRRCNRRRSKQPFIQEKSPVDTMSDQRTMAELLRAPTEGYAEVIVVPLILAKQFEIKHNLLNMMTSDQFFRLEKDNPHDHISFVKAAEEIYVTCGGAHPYYHCPAVDGNSFPELRDNIQGYVSAAVFNYNQDSSYQALMQQNEVVPLSELEKIKKMNEINMKAMQTQINNVKNELRNEMKIFIQALMFNQTNELKNMMARFFQMNTASTLGSGPLPSNTIANPKGKFKAITTRSGIVLDGPSVLMPHPFINPEEDERVEETLTDLKLAEYTINVPPHLVQKPKPPSQRNFMVYQIDPLHPNIPYPSRMHKQKQQEKDEVQIHKFWQMFKQLHINITLADALILIPKYQKMLKALLSDKEKLLELANIPLNENCSAVILKKLPEKLGDPGKFLIQCGFSELKCKALADLGASINFMPLSVWKKLGLPELISTRMTLKLANRAICTSAGIARDVFVPVGKFTFLANFESDPRVPLILGRLFLRIARSLIDVHGEEMILRDSDERLTLNMRHDTSSYSNQPQKESINMIDIYDDSCEDFLEDLFATNHLSDNPTFSSHINLTSPKVKDDIFDPEGDIVLDSTKDLPLPHNINPSSGGTTSSFPNHLLEEFADELALITFPSRNDDLPFYIESDIREIEYLLNHDPTKEMDSILKDSVDDDNLDDLNENLVDTIPKMFIDEHVLYYSSPLICDEYDDDLFELDSETDDAYNDPFDSKGEKIKDSKLLIDELDLPRSSDFLPSLEYDSFFFEDFSKVYALPSTNKEDRVFNPGILIQENLFEVTTRVAPDKNVKKIAISHASLILEDFDPPLSDYELPFLKEVLGSETLLSFSSEMRKKISISRFSLLKEFILLFSQNYIIRAHKLSKSSTFLKARWRFFLALLERTFVSWMFLVSISIPHERINSGVGSS
uniref:Reverse transcriptase domain-containing protein n=1 Tax=Tanacetum cinerariifolium TaxID=118510 RepID=A0A699H323_TANCI|nr:reverse transcriptase domain-containing protein [Tanacetum cinerariifolium]